MFRPAWEQAVTKANIRSAFATAGVETTVEFVARVVQSECYLVLGQINTVRSEQKEAYLLYAGERLFSAPFLRP